MTKVAIGGFQPFCPDANSFIVLKILLKVNQISVEFSNIFAHVFCVSDAYMYVKVMIIMLV